jgi:hypothetical protein
MDQISVTCPTHGDITITSDNITLMVCRQIDHSYYKFSCSGCNEPVIRDADEHIIAFLVSLDVEVVRWHLPAEVTEEHSGPRISYDELLDFGLALTRIDYLSAFADHIFHA